MIVCHCNVVARAEIEAAIRVILAEDAGAPLEPQHVYRALSRRGRCCGCFPAVARIVEEVLASADAAVDAPGVADAVRRSLQLSKENR